MDSESLGAAGGASLGRSFGHRLVFGSRLWIGGTLRGQNKSVPVTGLKRYDRTLEPGQKKLRGHQDLDSGASGAAGGASLGGSLGPRLAVSYV